MAGLGHRLETPPEVCVLWESAAGGNPFLRILRSLGWRWMIVLLVLLPIKDGRPQATTAAYDYAWDLFVHGRLIRCQQEAEQAYLRYRIPDPLRANRFRLLEAEVQLHRGLYQDALQTLFSILPSSDTD